MSNNITFTPISELNGLEHINTAQFDLYLILVRLIAEEGKWLISIGKDVAGQEIIFRVVPKDEIFKQKVDQGIILLQKGDFLKCHIKMTQWRNDLRLKTVYEVLEVKKHIPKEKRFLLFDIEEMI